MDVPRGSYGSKTPMQKIEDDLTDTTMKNGKPKSKQQRHIERRRKACMCVVSGCDEKPEPLLRDPHKFGPYCKKHKVKNRERLRKTTGAKRRYKLASSYEQVKGDN